MKYLLDFLSTLDGAPTLQDPDFQQLLVDVQAGKPVTKANDVFYENLEKIVNELKSTPEASAFLKPVSKREAPDYFDFIKFPMDLFTVAKQVKQHKYRSKADFARDLDLIWENCLIYNSAETHPLRASARFMRQKADHHLEFLADRVDRGNNHHIPGLAGSPAPSFTLKPTPGPSGLRNALGDDEDADGESDDAMEEAPPPPPRPVAGPSQPVYRDDRPNLAPSLDAYPALIRTSQSMEAGPSKPNKAREQAAEWGPVKDDAYIGMSLTAPEMCTGARRSGRIRVRGVRLEDKVVQRAESLNEAMRIGYKITDFQRVEHEGGVLPPIERAGWDKEIKREARLQRKRVVQAERVESRKRRRLGGEVGEREATLSMKKASAGMLAHAGFEGANEGALDLFTRITTEHLRNVGRTFRSLIDFNSKEMSSEEIILHALHENGEIRCQDLEAHIKDDIERDGLKAADMERRVRQAYEEITTAPVIGDDMLFADSGEMLTDGNFAEELGEDFLGLRDLGIAKEHGMSTLSVPSALFYGRRKRVVDAGNDKVEVLDFPPPPPFVPLQPASWMSFVPALLHAFFNGRVERGEGLADSPMFDQAHSQIGPLGQVIAKNPPPVAPKKKIVPVVIKEKEKKKIKKPPTGVGKGNWIRPSKEEKARRVAERGVSGTGGMTPGLFSASAASSGGGGAPHIVGMTGFSGAGVEAEQDAEGEDEDAEGEEE